MITYRCAHCDKKFERQADAKVIAVKGAKDPTFHVPFDFDEEFRAHSLKEHPDQPIHRIRVS